MSVSELLLMEVNPVVCVVGNGSPLSHTLSLHPTLSYDEQKGFLSLFLNFMRSHFSPIGLFTLQQESIQEVLACACILSVFPAFFPLVVLKFLDTLPMS